MMKPLLTSTGLYDIWKLDIIANNLRGVSTDYRIINNLNLIKKLFSNRKLTKNEIIKLADLYTDEFEKCKIYFTGSYASLAIKEHFESGRNDLKHILWDRYVISREDSINEFMKWKQRINHFPEVAP